MRTILASVVLTILLTSAAAGQWTPLGPDGGDARRLAYDPRTPGRILLSTTAGQLYLSNDNGAHWSRFAHLGPGDDYVLDSLAVDPKSGTIYVGGWNLNSEAPGGDLFRSLDHGKSWQTVADLHGVSIRALALSPSNTKLMVVGATDGVYRSLDGGASFGRISPLDHAGLENIESVAIDSGNPSTIYAGTRHLAWKTNDGGQTWQAVTRGVIDDSDVFSIMVDARDPHTVYLSACSGIYKSDDMAESFRRVQGIPETAERTRVLKQDPTDPEVVYAGTTAGLWKSIDGGKTWLQITAANTVVNDVLVDPQAPSRVFLATDRGGVLLSTDAGAHYVSSSRGFSHRLTSSVLFDRDHAATIYAGVINDKEFGGVFVSENGGQDWRWLGEGLRGHDVFALRQTANGTLLAGTNAGLFRLVSRTATWQPIHLAITELVSPSGGTRSNGTAKPPVPDEIAKQDADITIRELELSPKAWYVAGSSGLLRSVNEGRTWQRLLPGLAEVRTVRSFSQMVLVTTARHALLSRDGGVRWLAAVVPAFVSAIYDAAIAESGTCWLATREGLLRTSDWNNWEHVALGLPAGGMRGVLYDADNRRLWAIAESGQLFSSRDSGRSWQLQASQFAVRSLAISRGRVLAATAFDGVILHEESAGR